MKAILQSVIPVVKLQRNRSWVLEFCHSVLGESIHFKEDMHPVVNVSSICARNYKGVFFSVTQEYSYFYQYVTL